MNAVVTDIALLYEARDDGCVVMAAIDEVAHRMEALRSPICSEETLCASKIKAEQRHVQNRGDETHDPIGRSCRSNEC
jgi:hypothetical protein